jgi:hypothetical protein
MITILESNAVSGNPAPIPQNQQQQNIKPGEDHSSNRYKL